MRASFDSGRVSRSGGSAHGIARGVNWSDDDEGDGPDDAPGRGGIEQLERRTEHELPWWSAYLDAGFGS